MRGQREIAHLAFLIGVSCNMPKKWASGTTFYCTILGVGLSLPIERVRAKVTSSGAALKGPSLAPACEAGEDR